MNAQNPPTSSATVVALDRILGASPDGDGVHWSLEPANDLNINLVHLDPGSGVVAHTNHDLDVVVIVLAGTGHLCVDGTDHELLLHVLALAPRGTERSIGAGIHGLTYLTVHRRRGPLGITPSSSPRA